MHSVALLAWHQPLRHAAPRLALPTPADFASPFSWDAAYQSEAENAQADWLLPYSGQYRSALLARLDARHSVLELGCGTSSLAAGLAADGFAVTACDASREAVRRANARKSGDGVRPRYVVADARATGLATGAYGGIVDKGTLDAICSNEGFDGEARRVAAEVRRLLRPGGAWVCLSLMPPALVLPLLADDGWASLGSEPLRGDGRTLHLYTAVRAGAGAGGGGGAGERPRWRGRG